VEIIPAYIRQGGAAEQGFDVPVHDVLDVQGNAFRGARYEDVILSVCAGLKANAVRSAPKIECGNFDITRPLDG
jgi:hypothetical protein